MVKSTSSNPEEVPDRFQAGCDSSIPGRHAHLVGGNHEEVDTRVVRDSFRQQGFWE